MQITMLIPMRPPGVSAISTPLKALVVCNVKTVQDVPLRTVRLRELRLWSAMCTSWFFFFFKRSRLISGDLGSVDTYPTTSLFLATWPQEQDLDPLSAKGSPETSMQTAVVALHL